MSYSPNVFPKPRRLLLLAFCCHPRGAMEHRNGWHRAVLAGRAGYETTVLYCPCSTDLDSSTLAQELPEEVRGLVNFVPVTPSSKEQEWLGFEPTFYSAYKKWHRRAFKLASDLHASNPFDLTHTATLCGFREPGFLWTLNIPHVWGPIGGNHIFPMKFSKLLSRKDRYREIARSILNWVQLNATPRVRKAAKQSKVVIAATTPAQKAFQHAFGIELIKELETGIESVREQPRSPRQPGVPLKILWAGRLRGWKALPLLLHAISRLTDRKTVVLRVLGDGNCLHDWQKLATTLGLADQVEWIPWPTYAETLPHYAWADVFAFTSLRDTSGTGLLEALAAGCPVLSVDHQGAVDIVDSSCGLMVPVNDLNSTIQSFADAIENLWSSPELWKRLSDGSIQRAKSFLWNARLDQTNRLYQTAMAKYSREVSP